MRKALTIFSILIISSATAIAADLLALDKKNQKTYEQKHSDLIAIYGSDEVTRAQVVAHQLLRSLGQREQINAPEKIWLAEIYLRLPRIPRSQLAESVGRLRSELERLEAELRHVTSEDARAFDYRHLPDSVVNEAAEALWLEIIETQAKILLQPVKTRESKLVTSLRKWTRWSAAVGSTVLAYAFFSALPLPELWAFPQAHVLPILSGVLGHELAKGAEERIAGLFRAAAWKQLTRTAPCQLLLTGKNSRVSNETI